MKYDKVISVPLHYYIFTYQSSVAVLRSIVLYIPAVSRKLEKAASFNSTLSCYGKCTESNLRLMQ